MVLARTISHGIRGGAIAALLLAVCSACASPSVLRSGRPVTTERFVFHSAELTNLHHFLYRCAQAVAQREEGQGSALEVAEMPEVDALTGADRAAWDAAIAFYRAEAIQRDLLFDDRMYALKQALAAIEDADGEWPADVDPGFEAALRSALPVYGAKFWPAHDYQNRVWIDEAVALLERFEEPLAERMMAAYGGAWPAEGVRVDVCAYANWAGAYTTGGPAHVTLSSGDPQGHGHGALELLMHEASHTRAMFRSFREELDAAVAARGAQAPRDLWHLFMFVTAGEVTRRTLADAGIAYTTYGERSGVYERGLSVALVPTVLREWGGYLAGEVSRDEALARIADAVHEL